MSLRNAIPIFVFLAVAKALFAGLFLNPSEVPSGRVGGPVPSFEASIFERPGETFSSAQFVDGEMKLINVFGSWCLPCVAEHPYLTELERRGVKIYAIDNKDTEEGARAFFARLGNPFYLVLNDPDGRIGIELGISGVPETFVVNGDGVITYQHIGPLSVEALEREIMPRIDGDIE